MSGLRPNLPVDTHKFSSIRFPGGYLIFAGHSQVNRVNHHTVS
jgi:hypothetical protein